jgi:hypothetical protein
LPTYPNESNQEGFDLSTASGTLALEYLRHGVQVGDQQRGYLLELLLTKLRYSMASVDEEFGEGLQIVGMSATMSNAAAFAQWLDAQLYETTFRPVALHKFYKVCMPLQESSISGAWATSTLYLIDPSCTWAMSHMPITFVDGHAAGMIHAVGRM